MVSVKERKTSNLFGVYLVGAIMVWFGGLLGFAYLTAFPMKAFASIGEYEDARASADSPRLPKPGDGWFISGPILASGSWEAKREALKAEGPQTVSLSAGEMNAWVNARLSATTTPLNKEDSNLVVVPGLPNFAVVEGRGLYINLPLAAYVFGTKREYTLTAIGSVGEGGFKPLSVSLNRAALPFPEILGAQVVQAFAQAFQSTEDYEILAQAFNRAESISVEANTLVFNLR
jgi:hypothetical protein